MANSDQPSVSTQQRVLQALKDARAHLEASERAKREPIAIIGIGIRLPGGVVDVTSYWRLLRDGVDACAPIPAERWAVDEYYDPNPEAPGKMYTRSGAFLENVDQFDPHFFGITPREAAALDPQQRLLAEVAWEALEHAGYAPDRLKGSQTGVFIGLCWNDYGELFDPASIGAHSASGNHRSFAAGRLSYLLGLHGPSIQLDTACSSSLVAAHLACQSLRSGECDLALAGGVNLMLTPTNTINISKLRALTPAGGCKTFDADADGYMRGEGCGVIVLKRLSDALADQDRIIALIRGSATNHDGTGSGLLVPNQDAQEQLLRRAQRNADVDPNQIAYVEAHGTGTTMGDPIEVGALGTVYGADREQPLYIGTVKTNIGHLEGAAGVAGLIKVALALQHQEIPPNLHFRTPSPHIPWDEFSLIVPTEPTPWPEPDTQRFAGVSGFGFSGANAHVILEQAPLPTIRETAGPERPCHLLALSAKTEPALLELARRYRATIAEQAELAAPDLCFTANTGRSHFAHRLALTGSSTAEFADKLDAFAAGRDVAGLVRNQIVEHTRPRVAFLFTGQGAQYPDMGRQLYDTQPVFRQTIEQCDAILRSYLERPLLELLYPPAGADVPELRMTAYAQPALFAVDYALAELWRSWGVTPAAVLGHSVGEYVAACVAGVFSLEDGLKLIAARGRLMQAVAEPGAMLAVNADETQVQAAISPLSDAVSIAAVNAPEQVVISGRLDAVESIATVLADEGIKTSRLNVSHAFHSPLMTAAATAFEQEAASVTYRTPRLSLIANLTGARVSDEITTPRYWSRHLREPVRFADGINTLLRENYDIFVEAGPEPVLLGMGRQCPGAEKAQWLPSLRRQREDWPQLLESLGALYTLGVNPDWQRFDKPYARRRVTLPTYPFQRQRYWVEQPVRVQRATPVSTPILEHLAHGDIADVERALLAAANLNETEQQLVPKLLEALVAIHRRQQQSARIQDWLYQVAWRPSAIWMPNPEDMPPPGRVRSALQPLAAELTAAPELQDFAAVAAALDELSARYIEEALQPLADTFQVGEWFADEVAVARLGVRPEYRRLLVRLLRVLKEKELLRANHNQWTLVRAPVAQDAQASLEMLLQQYPHAQAELTLLGRCGARLLEVLRGSCDPLQLLFPEGDLAVATDFFESSPSTRAMNTLLQQAVVEIVRQLPAQRTVRILEIGAGTGGATAHVLPILPAERTQYHCTDISPFFTEWLRKRFAAYPFVEYRLLDIEQAPAEQGFEAGYYDLIIAANALHATQELAQTLSHVRQLLAPGGMLLLYEGVMPLRWLDLTFGLTAGWWRFADRQLRLDYPLLPVSRWESALRSSGFAQVTNLVPADSEHPLFAQQAVLLAQTDASVTKAKLAPKPWLIFADTGGTGRALADLLAAAGAVPILIFAADNFEQTGPRIFCIDADEPADYRRLLAQITAELGGVVHLWSLDTPTADALQSEDLVTAAQTGCGSILWLTQALTTAKPAPLWLVTRGAQAVDDTVPASGLVQAPLWGMALAIAQEHPELACQRVDLEPNAAAAEAAKLLFTEISTRSPEDQIVYRNGRRLVPRLARLAADAGFDDVAAVRFDAQASYLITGGLGGLGLETARWMARQGARYLILAGRGEPSVAARRQLTELENAGIRVTAVQLDVTRTEQVAKLLNNLAPSAPPLRGVIHAAGVLADATLRNQSWQRFSTVLAPKLEGAWNLHTLTRGFELDFFVLYSSAASLLGAQGQANHSAANAFLDSLAGYRRALGLPGLSIHWGPWEQIGQAAERHADENLRKKGIGAIAPAAGIEALARIFQHPAARVGVVPIDWPTFLQRPFVASTPFYAEVKPAEPSPEAALPLEKPPAIGEQLADAAPSARFELLLNYFRTELANAAGLEFSQLDMHKPLTQMGFDSLMAAELRTRISRDLGVNLSLTDFLDGGSVFTLASKAAESTGTPPPATVPDSEALLERLDRMDEGEVDALLQTLLSDENNQHG